MKSYVSIFVLLIVLLFSCKKEYTQREKDRIEELTASHIYKYKVPDESFVFCLDTIKADFEYTKLADEYCRRGQEVDSYLYLSSYKIYVPIIVDGNCGVIACYKKRNVLSMKANEELKWLINDELIVDLKKEMVDSILRKYFEEMEGRKISNRSMIFFDVHKVKSNRIRDSLFVSIMDSYYDYIKMKRKETNQSIEYLKNKYPFNLLNGDAGYYMVNIPPPPPPSIIID